MKISYRAAYQLIDRFYTRKSLETIIEDCSSYFSDSLTTANSLEDYVYLSVMDRDRSSLSKDFIVFFNYKNFYPTVLKANEDLSIEAFAVLCIDCNDIPKEEFIEVVHSQALGAFKDTEAIEIVNRFNQLTDKIKQRYRFVEEKIGRNEYCPCGSKIKFKKCHGSIISPTR